jgi:hypothetical protein
MITRQANSGTKNSGKQQTRVRNIFVLKTNVLSQEREWGVGVANITRVPGRLPPVTRADGNSSLRGLSHP